MKKIIKICKQCKEKFNANSGSQQLCKSCQIHKCLSCGNKFIPPISETKRNCGKFCSRKCYYKSEKGQPTWNKNKKCPEIAGENHPMWKGGRRKSNGYILIYSPNHPFTVLPIKTVLEHRLVAEKCLGRYLTKVEVIHHISGIKNDNRPENLYLFKNHSNHMSYHFLFNRPKLKSNLLTQFI